MRLPTPPEIADAPELAALAGADHALEMMRRALIAANPELLDQEFTPASGPALLPDLALDLISHAAALTKLIERYAERIDRERATSLDDVTF